MRLCIFVSRKVTMAEGYQLSKIKLKSEGGKELKSTAFADEIFMIKMLRFF